MKNPKPGSEIEGMAEEISDGIVDTILNSKKMGNIEKTLNEQNEIITKNAEQIKSLRAKVLEIEKRVSNQIGKVEIDVTEAEMLIAEKWQKFEEERYDETLELISQIQRLRDMVIKLAIEAKRSGER